MKKSPAGSSQMGAISKQQPKSKQKDSANTVDISFDEDGPLRSVMQFSDNRLSLEASSCMASLVPSSEDAASAPRSVTMSMSTINKPKRTNFDDKSSAKGGQLPSPAVKAIPKPPTTFFDVVSVPFKISEKAQETHVHFSLSMVVRFIGSKSCLLPFLLVGDQVLEVNGNAILTTRDFETSLFDLPNGVIRLVRPWNTTHLGERQPSRKNKDCSYHVVNFHKFPAMANGFEIVTSKKICEVTKIKTGQRGAHAFFRKDRLLDVDSVPVSQLNQNGSLVDVRKKFNTTLRAQNMCSFLVERPLSLRSSANASLIAARMENPPPIVMGDDAAEIGAREATRIRAMGDTYKLHPLLKSVVAERMTTTSTYQTSDADDSSRRKKKQKKKKKSVSYDGKLNRCSKVPSDVKDEATLVKVTPKSGIINFVKNYLNRGN